MLKNYKKIEHCRCCSNEHLIELIDLGVQSFSGIFPTEKEEVPVGRLRLVKCHGENVCGLVQLDRDFDQSIMYGENYGYRSGLNSQMVKHLKHNVDVICEKVRVAPNAVILDIGANDGTTLSFYPKNTTRIGIDPTISKFGDYYDEGILKCAEFFTSDVFRKICLSKAKVITSFSMFYDLPNPIEFAMNIAEILDDNGIWVLEQSDLMMMFESLSIDTICHEHTEYYSVSALNFIMKKADLKIIDIDFNDVNGGSSRIFVTHVGSSLKVEHEKIQAAISREKDFENDPSRYFQEFIDSFHNEIEKLKYFLKLNKQNGVSIYGLGASTKGNTLLQLCGLDAVLLDCIGEINPDKFGKYTPGTNIPIVDEREIIENENAIFFILPWHFKESFINQKTLQGRTKVFALPFFEIIP